MSALLNMLMYSVLAEAAYKYRESRSKLMSLACTWWPGNAGQNLATKQPTIACMEMCVVCLNYSTCVVIPQRL